MSKYKPPQLSDADKKLFRRAIANLEHIPSAEVAKTTGQKPQERASSTRYLQQLRDIQLSDHLPYVEQQNIAGKNILNFARPGVQKRVMDKLKRGQFAIEASLDLHSLTVSQSKERLLDFLAASLSNKRRIIHIIHGKGYHTNNNRPLLKNYVNHWLQQYPFVLAFSSCIAKHGGTGAVYVLLKRS